MLHEFPITNARLLACHEDWQQMTPTAQGRHCAQCDREVLDLTRATAAELAAARAMAPDGRVCARLRPAQLAAGRPVRLGLWARVFVVALALVIGQGLTARQAWAQTKRASVHRRHKPQTHRPTPTKAEVTTRTIESVGLVAAPADSTVAVPEDLASKIYNYTEELPQPPGGLDALQPRLRRPAVAGAPAGRVFVRFVVETDGRLMDMQVRKGLGGAADAEALRVVQQLPQPWTPGRQNGRLVRVEYILPITFGVDMP